LNVVWFAERLHARGSVDSVPPQVVMKVCSAHDAGNRCAAVDADAHFERVAAFSCLLLALGIGVVLAVQVAASDLTGTSWRLVSIASMDDTVGLHHDPARALPRGGQSGAIWIVVDVPARESVQAFRKSSKISRADILWECGEEGALPPEELCQLFPKAAVGAIISRYTAVDSKRTFCIP
jgi:hypothetical protein